MLDRQELGESAVLQAAGGGEKWNIEDVTLSRLFEPTLRTEPNKPASSWQTEHGVIEGLSCVIGLLGR